MLHYAHRFQYLRYRTGEHASGDTASEKSGRSLSDARPSSAEQPPHRTRSCLVVMNLRPVTSGLSVMMPFHSLMSVYGQ